jgi:hypothetical protein
VDDATLDEFGTDGDGTDTAEDDEATGESGAASDAPDSDRTGDDGDAAETRLESEGEGTPPEGPDPVVTTYAWAEAGQCGNCGTDAAERWRREGTLVCPACASWE